MPSNTPHTALHACKHDNGEIHTCYSQQVYRALCRNYSDNLGSAQRQSKPCTFSKNRSHPSQHVQDMHSFHKIETCTMIVAGKTKMSVTHTALSILPTIITYSLAIHPATTTTSNRSKVTTQRPSTSTAVLNSITTITAISFTFLACRNSPTDVTQIFPTIVTLGDNIALFALCPSAETAFSYIHRAFASFTETIFTNRTVHQRLTIFTRNQRTCFLHKRKPTAAAWSALLSCLLQFDAAKLAHETLQATCWIPHVRTFEISSRCGVSAERNLGCRSHQSHGYPQIQELENCAVALIRIPWYFNTHRDPASLWHLKHWLWQAASWDPGPWGSRAIASLVSWCDSMLHAWRQSSKTRRWSVCCSPEDSIE